VGLEPADFGAVLAARLADIAAAAARYDAYAFTERPAPEPAGPGAGEDGGTADAARDLALAALRTAGDPLSYAMLRRMADADTTLAELAVTTGLPRLAVWERLNSLVAAGLAARRHDADAGGLTPAGAVLVELVEAAVLAVTGNG
jgi:hypothetical protein